MRGSLLLPLCPKGAGRQPRDRGNGRCPPAAAHVGNQRLIQHSTRRGHGPGRVLDGGHQVIPGEEEAGPCQDRTVARWELFSMEQAASR